MVVASFTQIGKEYEVTLNKDGQAIDCECMDHICRHRECKHMSNANWQVRIEIDRAARFLAIKAQVEQQERERRENAACYMRMMESEY